MKILFVCLELYNPSHLGGIQRYNQRMVRALVELGHQVRTVSLWDQEDDIFSAIDSTRHYSGRRQKIRTIFQFVEQVVIFRPDVILFGHVLLIPLAIITHALRLNIKHLLIIHGEEVWRKNLSSGFLTFLINGFIDNIISVSQTTIILMRKVYNVDPNKYLILPNSIDTNSSTYHLKSAAKSSSFTLISVARLDKHSTRKGLDKVISALPAICARFPQTQYIIVGDGPLRKNLEILAHKCSVSQHVKFVGRVSDEELQSFYREADIFIMPSSQEGFGIVYLEAWLHNLPVIAGMHDAGREVVTHGINGLVVDPDAIDEISDAVIWLLEHPEEARRMGAVGYQTVVERYNHITFRERLAAILRCICAE